MPSSSRHSYPLEPSSLPRSSWTAPPTRASVSVSVASLTETPRTLRVVLKIRIPEGSEGRLQGAQNRTTVSQSLEEEG